MRHGAIKAFFDPVSTNFQSKTISNITVLQYCCLLTKLAHYTFKKYRVRGPMAGPCNIYSIPLIDSGMFCDPGIKMPLWEPFLA